MELLQYIFVIILSSPFSNCFLSYAYIMAF